jgi:hypothetical protein
MAVRRGGRFGGSRDFSLDGGFVVIGRVSMLYRILAACMASACLLTQAFAGDAATIVIVRHGEKPADGLGQLSCKGLNRSLALAPLLLARYGNPVAIYAPNPAHKKRDKGTAYAYIRPLATIEPLAIRVGLPVNLDWGMTDIRQLAKALLAQPGGTQVVAWEHHLVPKLAKELLAALNGKQEEVPDWGDADFDGIYVIRITGQGKDRRATFTRESEGLDQLPDTCSP